VNCRIAESPQYPGWEKFFITVRFALPGGGLVVALLLSIPIRHAAGRWQKPPVERRSRRCSGHTFLNDSARETSLCQRSQAVGHIPRVLIVERGWCYDITGKRANRFSVVQITLVAVTRELFSIQNRTEKMDLHFRRAKTS